MMNVVKQEAKPGFSILEVDREFPSQKARQIAFQETQQKRFSQLNDKYRREMLDSLNSGHCPLFPDETENTYLVDTTVPVKLSAQGPTSMKDVLFFMGKIKQSELGAPTPEYVTDSMIYSAQKNGFNTKIIESERANGIPTIQSVREDPKNDSSKIIDYKVVTYYNLCQVENPDALMAYLTQRYLDKYNEKREWAKQKYGDKAYKMEDKTEYPSIKKLDFNGEAMRCDGENAVEIAAQIIVAGLNNMPLRMYKGESKLLKKELTKLLTSEKSIAISDFGRKVGKNVKNILRAEKIDKNMDRKKAAEEYEIGR